MTQAHEPQARRTSLVNESLVRELARPYRVSAHFCDALDQRMRGLLMEAQRRAQANGRTTLMPHDA